MENNFEGTEKKELNEVSPKVKIYLLRHADKPADVVESESMEEDTPLWHIARHSQGMAPRLPKESWVDLGKFVIKDNSLSLKGIIEAHDFANNEDIINKAVQDFRKGRIRVLFYNTNAYRTTETNQIIAEEVASELDKLKEKTKKSGDIGRLRDLERISLEQPDIEGLANQRLEEERDESTEKSVEDIDSFVREMQEKAIEMDENLLVFATTHADKIENYIESKTGEKKEVGTTESFLIEE